MATKKRLDRNKNVKYNLDLIAQAIENDMISWDFFFKKFKNLSGPDKRAFDRILQHMVDETI